LLLSFTNRLNEYDTILNDHDNEWDMYKWMVGNAPVPAHLQDSKVMHMLVEHASNQQKELRIELPPLKGNDKSGALSR
jgi:succinate dehydrogenase flavin-adding protein (antitoxin of CptAB toxin-antitoxin module)